MKILFVSRRFFPEMTGGGQISALRIAQAVQDQGTTVQVLTFTDKKDFEEKVKGVKVIRKKMPSLKMARRFSNLDYMYWQMRDQTEKIVEQFKPDVVHLLNFESIPYTAQRLKKRWPNLVITATVNGPIFGCFTQLGIDWRDNPCLKCTVGKRFLDCFSRWGIRGPIYWLYSLWYMPLLRRSYKSVDKFFIVSKAMSPILSGMKVPESKMQVIHNPIDIFPKKKSNLKKKLKIGNRKVILYAGRVEKDKGVHTVIEAMKKVDNAVFVIVGWGKDIQEFKELASDISERVKFIGYVKPKELAEYYSIADLVAFPCTIYESLSRMLLEAASYSVPLIVSDRGGNSEIVQSGYNGVVLKQNTVDELAKQIKRLVDNNQLRKRMGQNAKKSIKENFSPKKIGKKLVDAYTRIRGR